MLAVKLRTNLRVFERGLDEFHRRQVPFAAAMAITDMAKGVQGDIVESMKTTFDRPTPYTQRATYVKAARKSDLTAFVGIREFSGKGTPAWKYLGPQAQGGARRQKRFERRLASTNAAAPYALPGEGAQLDSYGNMSRGQISKILSAVGALGDTGQNLSTASAKRRGRKRLVHKGSRLGQSEYFIARSKRTKKPIGIYQLVAKGQVREVLRFTDKAPSYEARWPINDIVLDSLGRHREGAFERAWAKALATAR